jgi:hypothetical protein
MEAEGNKERREVVAPDLTVLFPPPRSLAGTRRLLHHWLRHREAATPDPARLCRLLRREVISVEKRRRGGEEPRLSVVVEKMRRGDRAFLRLSGE